MSNLTITADDDLIRRARRKAAEEGTSLSAVMGEYLKAYVGPQDAASVLREMFEIADLADSSVGEAGITGTRDDLYDRARPR